MASKQKPPAKPGWTLSFEVSPEPTIGRDGQPRYRAAAIARRGELAYLAEIELGNWAEDIAAFFEQVRPVFFEAEVSGLPEFPEMGEEAAVEPDPPADETPIEADETTPARQQALDLEASAQDGQDDPNPQDAGPLSRADFASDDDYYAALADVYEAERAARGGYTVALYGPEQPE